MNDLRKAAQQAAGAVDAYIGAQLTVGQRYTNEGQGLLDALTALRAALAEPEHAELERKSDAIQRLWKERDELLTECRTLVRQNGEWQEFTAELVEALRRCRDMVAHPDNLAFIDAALAKVEAGDGS